MLESLPKSWRRGFETAMAASVHSNGSRPGEKLGAALYNGKNLASIGFNTYGKTHPSSKQYVNQNGTSHSGCVHAEAHALIKRRHYNDSRQTIYVYRSKIVNGKRIPTISRPCINCQGLLKVAGVKIARYINDAGQPEEMRLT